MKFADAGVEDFKSRAYSSYLIDYSDLCSADEALLNRFMTETTAKRTRDELEFSQSCDVRMISEEIFDVIDDGRKASRKSCSTLKTLKAPSSRVLHPQSAKNFLKVRKPCPGSTKCQISSLASTARYSKIFAAFLATMYTLLCCTCTERVHLSISYPRKILTRVTPG